MIVGRPCIAMMMMMMVIMQCHAVVTTVVWWFHYAYTGVDSCAARRKVIIPVFFSHIGRAEETCAVC